MKKSYKRLSVKALSPVCGVWGVMYVPHHV